MGKNYTNELTTEELSDELEMLLWEFGKRFKISESSSRGKQKSFTVDCLHVETEDDVIIFDDCENRLIINNSVLIGFLSEDLLLIEKTNNDDKLEYDLKFKNGLVRISVI